MQPDVPYTSKLVARIKDAIAKECSKRHVPKYIFETPEIPVCGFIVVPVSVLVPVLLLHDYFFSISAIGHYPLLLSSISQ